MSSFLHSGDLGDVIYTLPIVRDLGGGIYYLCDKPDITKPMTQWRFEALRALMIEQPYIKDVQWHKGQKIKYDFCQFRSHYHWNQTLTESHRQYLCPQTKVNTDVPWLIAPNPIEGDQPIIARSPRYQNPAWEKIWPRILKKYPNPIFIGLPEEHRKFCEKFGEVMYRHTSTLLEVANLIAGSPIFIGNQSSPNSVCEGLKHNSILEYSKEARDCIFPRKNTRHILSVGQLDEFDRQERLMLLLQCHPGDMFQARDLTQLIADIEPFPRNDVEFTLSWRRDTNPYTVDEILRFAREKFEVVHSIRGSRRDTGWPNGCNGQWQESMDLAWKLRREGKSNASAVLTFEPDCLPLRTDWINALKAGWTAAKADGFHCLGHYHGHNGREATHVNGNAVFAINILEISKRLGDSEPRTGWDVYAGDALLKITRDSDLIYQEYRIMEIDRAKIESIRKFGQIPALFHGVKDRNGVKIIRDMLRDGTLANRNGPTIQAAA